MKKNPLVAIVNTSACNLLSVIYACKSNEINTKVIREYENPNSYDGIIFPGVGNFGFVSNLIFKNKLDKFIKHFIDKEKPGLFICLGMQILFESSEESEKSKGLSIFKGHVKKIKKNITKIKSPIIGWNEISIKKKSIFFDNIKNNNFYFTHSYFCDPKNRSDIHSTVEKENFSYCSSINHKKIFACQFHPEKSSSSGLSIYKNLKLQL